MSKRLNQLIAPALAERRASPLWRTPVVVNQQRGAHIVVCGKSYVNFSSNDYLGATQQPLLRATIRQLAATYDAGSTASPLVTGYHGIHQHLCDVLCDWVGGEAALLFNCGYSANTALIQAFSPLVNISLHDRLNHASLLEAARLQGKSFRRYAHNDMAALRQLLATQAAPALVASEGIFSMDGDGTPLASWLDSCQHYQAITLLDDAHGLGVVGPQGAGSLSAAGFSAKDVDLLVVTFGKALGCAGAAVIASKDVIEYLQNFSKSTIYSTAMAPLQAGCVAASIGWVRGADEARERLTHNIQLLRARLSADFQLLPSDSAIQPLIVGDSEQALTIAQKAREQGYWLTAIRPPTVPQGSARIRITLSALHTQAHINGLCDVLEQTCSR